MCENFDAPQMPNAACKNRFRNDIFLLSISVALRKPEVTRVYSITTVSGLGSELFRTHSRSVDEDCCIAGAGGRDSGGTRT
jgi:hypothetical protein